MNDQRTRLPRVLFCTLSCLSLCECIHHVCVGGGVMCVWGATRTSCGECRCVSTVANFLYDDDDMTVFWLSVRFSLEPVSIDRLVPSQTPRRMGGRLD